MDGDHSRISKDWGSTACATRVINPAANDGIKEPPIAKATSFLADGFKGFVNDTNKRKKNADDEDEEEFHSAMVKAYQAHLLYSNEYGNDNHEWKELKKVHLEKMKSRVRKMISEGEKEKYEKNKMRLSSAL